METKKQFEQAGAYESPLVECVEVAVEQGFLGSFSIEDMPTEDL